MDAHSQFKKHYSRKAVRQWTAKGTNHRNSEDRIAPIEAVENQQIKAGHHALYKVTGNQLTSLPEED